MATRSHVDPELAKISDMVNGVSGISLGTGTGSSQRIACFETAGNGNYFYGIGLVEQTGSLPGMGIWASTGANVPHQNSSSSSGVNPHLMVSNIGNVGIGVVAPTQRLHVVGNILCSGTISGSSKSFDIEHPDPDKAEQKYRLRHWCVESDVAGGMVMYRKQITTTKASTVFIEMPNWFEHLVKNVIVFCSPDEHFGNAWGKYINNNFRLELEFSQRDELKLDAKFTSEPSASNGSREEADIDTTSVFINGFYDFQPFVISSSSVTPYLGGGIGFSRNQLGTTTLTSQVSSVYTLTDGAKLSQFAYKFAAGVLVNLTKKLSIDVNYQFVDLGRFKASKNYLAIPSGVRGLSLIHISEPTRPY